MGGEVFALACGDGGGRVFLAQRGGCGAGLQRFEYFSVEAAIEEDEETEVVAKKDFALARPSILMFAGRFIEPVASKGKVLAQGGEGVIAWVIIAVETEMDLLRAGDAGKKDNNESDCWQAHRKCVKHEAQTEVT